jgi:serine protease AprX
LPETKWNIYPNPFSVSTTLSYQLVTNGPAEFIIYNHFGQVIEKIVQLNSVKGNNRMTWDADGLPAGIYYCKFIFGNQVASTKMVKI